MVTTWRIIELATGKTVGEIKCDDPDRAVSMWCWIHKVDQTKYDWGRK